MNNSNDKDIPQPSRSSNERITILPQTELQSEFHTTLPSNKNNFINEWISKNNFSSITSEANESTEYSSSVVDDDQDINQILNTMTQDKPINITNNLEYFQKIFNSTNSRQTVENVVIESLKDIHVGNITYITGPIHITHYDDIKTRKTLKNSISDNETQEIISNSIFIGNINRSISNRVLSFVDRRTWLAQKPFEPYDYLKEPAEFVIISHSATEMGTTQAENVYLVRHIQCFHIESNRWNDISYNFLIGCDGNIYEGWGVVGAHTLGYNSTSIGISFIGCFMRELPLKASLDACKNLIKRGVELGYISPQYKLLPHCQCRPTESPGRMLYDELKSWPHFYTDE